MAARSARSARRHTPDIRIVAHLAETPPSELRDAFDEIKIDIRASDRFGYKQLKAKALIESTADATIFLDTDTLVATNLHELFDLMGACDIAAAIDPTRTMDMYQDVSTKGALAQAPATAPFLNSGVIAIRRSDEVLRFLEAWRDAIPEDGVPRDQWSFRRLVYESDLRLRVLPPEFNARTLGPVTLSGPVRILHMYDMLEHSAPEVLAFLNSWTGKRVFTPHDGRLLEQLAPFSVRYRYLREFAAAKTHVEHAKLTFRQHLRDLAPSLLRSVRYRLFREAA
jgi:hypothetical protein